jgi:predicted CXXCH cytochrome family protein
MDSETPTDTSDVEALSVDHLVALVWRLEQTIAELQVGNERLKQQLSDRDGLHPMRRHEGSACRQLYASIEPSIGCESCHGPGALHVQERTSEVSIAGEFDDTIVHPGKLSRELNEAICARCHLRGAGWSNVRGRSRNDFRPGLLMTDFRVDFAPQDSPGEMKVVGHFEQMRASRCYIGSDTLTCTTCHNPHVSPSAELKVEYYRHKCVECHEPNDNGCGLPEPERLAKSPADNCVTCHMPESGTDIPHFSFTHHRIGIRHTRQGDDQQEETLSALVPIGDVSRLSTLDLERCLGRAWLRYGDSLKTHARFAAFDEAAKRLHRVYQAGMQDAGVSGGLAYLHWIKREPLCTLY